MLLLVCTVIVLSLVYLIFEHYAKIKDYIQWRIQISKLPTIEGWNFFTGHFHKVIGVSNEDMWNILRVGVLQAPPVNTFYMGPFIVFVTVVEAEEIEAVISSMKNLPKAKIYDFLREWLEDGLLTSEGEKWHARRKILTPAFHFSILQEFVEIFTRETSNLVKEIEENHLNEPVDVVPLISNFTLLTINETSMGTKLNTKTKEGLEYKEAIYRMGRLLLKRILTPWFHNKFIFDHSVTGKTEKKLVKVMHDFTNNIIRKRSENFEIFEVPKETDQEIYAGKRKHPLLDILLNSKLKNNSINEQGIREEVNTFMFEGHDTTAASLTFSLMLLACHKEIQDDLYQEIIEILGTDLTRDPTYADLQNMSYMERFIKESLRLYPSVPFIARKLTHDVPTKYGLIPKGSTCFIHILDLHRNPKYWPDPDKFDPSRHLTENSRGRHPFAYIPFSAGPRNCIGQRFAMLEMKAAICGILRKFILEPVDTPETCVMLQDLVIRPKNGLKVKFVLRNI